MPNSKQLESMRQNIDDIDDKILQLLIQRVKYVHQIGEVKNKNNSNIYVPAREKSILDRLFSKSKNLKHSSIEAIFLEIFSMSRGLEKSERISYLGPEGSFTHQNAIDRFGIASDYIPAHNIEAIFTMVENKQCKYGVIPIENSSSGIVTNTIESFKKYKNVNIIAESVMDIHHCLSTNCTNLQDIKKIYSKDIAFMQCKEFLSANHLGEDKVSWIEVDSTSKGARISSKEPNSACICSKASAKINKMPILFNSIEDVAHNRTRFLTISDYQNIPTGDDKSSMLVTLNNKSGILYEFLKSFYEANIDLIKIKSHISGGITSFFIEFIGHRNDKNIKQVLSQHKDSICVLGSYIKQCDDI